MPKLVDASNGECYLQDLELANTFWTRLVGLQFRGAMAKNSGLLLAPCSSLHTCFMRFPIDVWMLDEYGIVLGVRRNLRPWRVAVCVRSTKQIIETNVDAIDLPVGARVQIDR